MIIVNVGYMNIKLCILKGSPGNKGNMLLEHSKVQHQPYPITLGSLNILLQASNL